MCLASTPLSKHQCWTVLQRYSLTKEVVEELRNYCKSRIFRTHSIFVSWALRTFVRMKFSYIRWLLRILWLALYLLHAFYFRTEAATFEIYENNMHTKYSGFTVFSTESEPKEIRLENLAVAVQQSGSWTWAVFFNPFYAFSMRFHIGKIRRQVCIEPDL